MPLSPGLRARLAARAKQRNLKMATAARMLLDERLTELEDAQTLSAAEEWQRAQAWATWEKIQAGDRTDVPMQTFHAHADRARAKLAAKTRRRG